MAPRPYFIPNDVENTRGPGGNAGTAETPIAYAVARELERPHLVAKPWGGLFSLLAGFFTLGVLPVILWTERFNAFVDEERRVLRRFAEWLRVHSSRPETIDLRVAGEDLGTRPMLSMLSITAVAGVALLFLRHLLPLEAPLVESLIAYTYQFNTNGPWQPPLTHGQKLYAAWGVGLSIAYLFQWLQVRGHVSDVRRFVNHANNVLRGSGMPGVAMPRVGLWLGLTWIAAAVFLASKGAWWGIPMALCGATQQRYMAVESARLRRTLAARVRSIAHLPGAGGFDPREEALALLSGNRRCPHVRCLAPLPHGARFCPRCGHNASAAEILTV